MLANEFIRLPIQMIDRMPARHAALGARAQTGHAQFLQAQHRHHGTHPADSKCRCQGHPRSTVRDKWGMPVARISGNVHPHTFEIGVVQAQRAEAWLKEAGAVSTTRQRGLARRPYPPASTRPAPAAWATIHMARW